MQSLKRVLVVDDDDVCREALSLCLQASGYELTEASDGMDALTRLQTGVYALVITDYRMPGLNGIELLQIIRKKWGTPVLLMSGNLDEGEEQVVGLYGARVLRKPIDRQTLLPLVKLAVTRGNAIDR